MNGLFGKSFMSFFNFLLQWYPMVPSHWNTAHWMSFSSWLTVPIQPFQIFPTVWCNLWKNVKKHPMFSDTPLDRHTLTDFLTIFFNGFPDSEMLKCPSFMIIMIIRVPFHVHFMIAMGHVRPLVVMVGKNSRFIDWPRLPVDVPYGFPMDFTIHFPWFH